MLEDVWLTLAGFDLVIALMCGGLWTWSERVVRSLEVVAPDNDSPLPRVSIIVPARNEQRMIEAGVRSLLGLDYPNLQITVVNDRSTDETATILTRIASEDSRLNVVTIASLPPGWLGKNNAMHVGAAQSSGEWLLFTDADVVFAPDALRRAVAFAVREKLDHIAAVPRITTPSFWLRAFVPVFSMCFVLFVKAWALRSKDPSAHVGIGAFNLVRAEAYRAVGGHEKLKLRPDDDVKLGKVLKAAGFQQDLVIGGELISVEWYASVGELIRGLEKNAFAGVDYRVPVIAWSAIGMILGAVLPLPAAVWFGATPTGLLFLLTYLVYGHFAGRACRSNGQSRFLGVLYPFGIFLFVFIQLRTTVLNLWQGGLRWRDTFYPLDELKRNVV
jgi:cellulose synthase/poly-beta-1,6-N-acetylglucosamine synthase-like glycosyltransferase